MSETGGSAGEDGYLTSLPFLATSDCRVTELVGGLTPWGSPLVSGLKGFDADGRPWLALVAETPISYMRLSEPLTTKQYEFLHLQRLAVDARIATGRDFYDAIIAESEPPDFVVSIGGRAVGIEMTQFTIDSRRQGQALFTEVVSRLAKQQRHRISHLTGYQLYLWFGSAEDPAGLPFKKHDSGSYDALVESIVAHVPDPDRFRVRGGEMPSEFDTGLVREVDDVQYFSIPLRGGVPASPFFAITGIQPFLAFQSEHVAPGEWERLRSAIDRKDRPGNDVLVISLGAPDRHGRCYGSEEYLGHFLLDNVREGLKPDHLESVVLHFWSTGRAVQLVGEKPTELWAGYMTGISPAFHPLRVLST